MQLPLPKFEPSPVGGITWPALTPTPVDSLPVAPVGSPELVTSVVLDSVDGPSSPEMPASQSNSRSPSSTGGDVRASRAAVEPTLADRLRLALSPPIESLLPGPNSLLPWPGELMPFQLDGVRTLINSQKILLADDMGLGKTIQVIAALRVLMMQRRIGSALIVAPASVLDQWRQELRKWAPELKAMVIRGSPGRPGLAMVCRGPRRNRQLRDAAGRFQ